MLIEETVTYLEMTSAEQLRPGRLPPAPVEMVELEAQPGGDVEIVVFGLVPEFVRRGFGAHLLTVGTRLAWELEPLDGDRAAHLTLLREGDRHDFKQAAQMRRSRGASRRGRTAAEAAAWQAP